MLELASHNNLPSGVVVSQSYVTPKAGQMAVILIITTNGSIWICQPLLLYCYMLVFLTVFSPLFIASVIDM